MRLLTEDECWQVRRWMREAEMSQMRLALRLKMTRGNLSLALAGRYGVEDDFMDRVAEATPKAQEGAPNGDPQV